MGVSTMHYCFNIAPARMAESMDFGGQSYAASELDRLFHKPENIRVEDIPTFWGYPLAFLSFSTAVPHLV